MVKSTVIWHVEDLKISHADKRAVGNIMQKLNDKFGKETTNKKQKKKSVYKAK